MSLLALPPVFAATRDGLQTVPTHMREAAYALGKTKITTIRRVLLPRVRSHVGTGVTLGMSRIFGDTAIVLLLAGGTRGSKRRAACPDQHSARHGLVADDLRLRQLAGRRRGRTPKGLRGRLRAAGLVLC